MQCRRLFQVVVAAAVVLTLSEAQGLPPMPAAPLPPAPAPVSQYPHVQSSHCRYLVNAPSPWGTNASPFKLYTRSYSGEVRRGYPIEGKDTNNALLCVITVSWWLDFNVLLTTIVTRARYQKTATTNNNNNNNNDINNNFWLLSL